MNSCDVCRFVYADLPVTRVPATLRDLTVDFVERMTSVPAATLARRPAPDIWSPLEYACHVRDVVIVQRQRIALALAVDNPEFESMDREDRVEREHYNEQQPAAVAAQLKHASTELADALLELTETQWERTGIYRWPTREVRTMAWVARHTVHELIHHLRDVDAGLAGAAYPARQ